MVQTHEVEALLVHRGKQPAPNPRGKGFMVNVKDTQMGYV